MYSICDEAAEYDIALIESYKEQGLTDEEIYNSIKTGELEIYAEPTKKLIEKGKLKYNEEMESMSYTTSAPFYAIVLNEDNMICINDTIFQYNENDIKLIIDGDFDKVKYLHKTKDSDFDKNIIVAKWNRNKDTYYPEQNIDCTDYKNNRYANCNSWGCKRITAWVEIKFFDYITSSGKPWSYVSYFTSFQTEKHSFGFWHLDKCYVNFRGQWEFYRAWLDWYYHTTENINVSVYVSGQYPTYVRMYEAYYNPAELTKYAFQGLNLYYERDDKKNVNVTQIHRKEKVVSRWWSW